MRLMVEVVLRIIKAQSPSFNYKRYLRIDGHINCRPTPFLCVGKVGRGNVKEQARWDTSLWDTVGDMSPFANYISNFSTHTSISKKFMYESTSPCRDSHAMEFLITG